MLHVRSLSIVSFATNDVRQIGGSVKRSKKRAVSKGRHINILTEIENRFFYTMDSVVNLDHKGYTQTHRTTYVAKVPHTYVYFLNKLATLLSFYTIKSFKRKFLLIAHL